MSASLDIVDVSTELVDLAFTGAKILATKVNRDERGELGVLEVGTEVSFPIERVFYIRAVGADIVRAEHAVSAAQIIVVLNGAVNVDLDNGHAQRTLTLDSADVALFVQGGVWRRLRDFAPGTVIMVLASKLFADTATYSGPRPDLIASPA